MRAYPIDVPIAPRSMPASLQRNLDCRQLKRCCRAGVQACCTLFSSDCGNNPADWPELPGIAAPRGARLVAGLPPAQLGGCGCSDDPTLEELLAEPLPPMNPRAPRAARPPSGLGGPGGASSAYRALLRGANDIAVRLCRGEITSGEADVLLGFVAGDVDLLGPGERAEWSTYAAALERLIGNGCAGGQVPRLPRDPGSDFDLLATLKREIAGVPVWIGVVGLVALVALGGGGRR